MADPLTDVQADLWSLIEASPGAVKTFVDGLSLGPAWPTSLKRYKATDAPWVGQDSAADDVSLRMHGRAEIVPGGVVRSQRWEPMRVVVVGRIGTGVPRATMEKLHQFAVAVIDAIEGYKLALPQPNIDVVPRYSLVVEDAAETSELGFLEFRLELDVTHQRMA